MTTGEPEAGTSRLGRFVLAVFAMFCLVLLGIGFCAGRASAHDWYAGQYSTASKRHGGFSCCSQRVDHASGYSGDCKPVRARMRGNRWFFDYDDVEYLVPDEAMMPDETNGQPLEAHGCVNHGKVLCFWRRAAGG